jgi:hypothetical protein
MMSNKNYSGKVNEILIYFIAILFFIAAVSKIIQFENFVNSIKSYSFVDPDWARSVGFAVILCEIWFSIGLLIKSVRLEVTMILIALTLIFTLVIINELITGNSSDCGCYIPFFENEIGWSKVLQNIALMLLLGHIYLNLSEGLEVLRRGEKSAATERYGRTNKRK